MKRLFFALFALFIISAPTKVWAITYEYKCAPTKVKIERTSTSSPYKYTLTITQNTQKTSSSSSTIGIENDVEVKIVLTTNSQTLEGEYNNTSLNGTYYYDLSAEKAPLNTSKSSSFKITRNDDGSYQISDGTIYTKHTAGDERVFHYCYTSVTKESASKGAYSFFPNWDAKYTMSNINTFKAVYNSATNGYDITFKVTGTNNNTDYSYDVSLFLANAFDLLGTFRTGTVTNTLMPKSTIVWSTTTRYPLEYTSLTISQVASNQYKLAGKLYALKDPSGTSVPYVYDFDNGVEFTFNAEPYSFSDEEDEGTLKDILDKRLRFDLTLSRPLSSGYYNTFCSPVTIPAGEVAALLGENAEVYEFASVSENAENGYTFTFSPLQGDIVAGVPYLVKPGSDIAQIELTNVPTSQLTTEAQTITTDNGFSFCGVLAPTNLSGSEYVLGDGDLLYKALPGQMKGMRAYFTFPAAQNGVAPRVALSFTNTPTDNAAPVADSEVKKYLYKNQLFIRSDKQTYLLQGIEKQ